MDHFYSLDMILILYTFLQELFPLLVVNRFLVNTRASKANTLNLHIICS